MRHIYILLFLCLLLPLGSRAQGPQTISGTVQTEAGTALPGATVIIKGTYTGGSCNEEG
ncbi:carboxypeptidase-like regulatory domain-containing protein [Hymenobacter sp. BT770]|uniref:carboxypeptidase-like regulatory domain-containing protein n=1 Tax=Hymenobacter sp. BT770 TaxID=2886942 RepID=UPI001D12389F|nr:carboxypeptidase-like regulatory domain-containing protein [Hymenobacter sp. BT770]MCC3154093.1 carboxypeptidase-like regulatory domain-containing protein [Hymenobacter sp. BT770]MDO3416237.1 carboxypeptidase-like regulatory domain-containing protein [Hymenobacter sp. BT770]